MKSLTGICLSFVERGVVGFYRSEKCGDIGDVLVVWLLTSCFSR